MNRLFAAVCATMIFSACNLELTDNTANNKKMEDTLFAVLPTVNRLTVEVKDNSNVIVTLGDAELYTATDEKRQEVTQQITDITRHIYSKDNDLKKGSVQFVENETSTDIKDPKTYPMSLP